MMNELQLSYPEDIVVREVITELFHFGILTPKDYVKFMARTIHESATWVFGDLMDYLEVLEKKEELEKTNLRQAVSEISKHFSDKYCCSNTLNQDYGL